MRYLRILCATLLTAVLTVVATAQTTVNRLVIPDMMVQAGGGAQLPIALENINEVAALQFDLILPAGITVDEGVLLSERAKTSHSVTAKMMNSETCRIIVISNNNKLVRGNSGDLIFLNVKIPASLKESATYRFQISNLVMSDIDGNGLPAEVSIGVVSVAKMPDLKISDLVVSSPTTIGPDSTVDLKWTVSNIGELPTMDGWTEQISLVGTDGASKYLLTTSYASTLDAGASVTRYANVKIPTVPTVDGVAVFAVKVVPDANAGEPKSALNNNEMITEQQLFVTKKLSVTLPSLMNEKHDHWYGVGHYATLTRSGSRMMAQKFKVTFSPADSRIVLPDIVTIESGQSSASFAYEVSNNSTLDNDSVFTITITGVDNDYPALAHTLKVVDDETPRLFIKSDKDVIQEGESFCLTVTSERAPKQDLAVSLSSNNSSRFRLPATLTIPAGKTTVTGIAEAVINQVPELDETFRIRTYAQGYTSQWTDIKVLDDDTPQLALSLSQTSISEGNVETPLYAVISRSTNIDKRVSIRLSSSSSELKVSKAQVVMEAGEERIEVPLSVVDNSIVDHSRKAVLTAQVYLSPNAVYAPSSTSGYASVVLEILDDDGPTLSIAATRSVWVEGGTGKLRVERNTLSNESAVTVQLTSDNEDRFSYEHTVTIPLGRTWVDVDVNVKRNTVTGDDIIAMFTATATDYNPAVCNVSVGDTSQPDAVVPTFTLSEPSVEITSAFSATAVVRNDGYDVLPAETEITVYCGKQAVATQKIGQDVAVDESLTLVIPLNAGTVVGNTEYHAVVNPNCGVKEMSYGNNTSKSAYIYVSPGFITTLSTDKQLYKPGDTVHITGKAVGNHAQDASVLIYMMWGNGIRQTIATTCDLNGEFAVDWQPYAGQAGHVAIGSCHPSEYSTAEQAGIDIYGLRLTSKSGLKYDVEEDNDVNHTITIYNPGPQLTNVKAQVVAHPSNCDVILENSNIAVLPSCATAEIPMRITNTKPSTMADYDAIEVNITSAEGPSVESTDWLHCSYHQAHLELSQNRFTINLVKDKSREIQVDITNVGLRETGQVSCLAQQWVTNVSPIGSIQPGETVTATLRLEPPANAQLTYPYPSSRVSFTCENGDAALMFLDVTVVSESNGRLILTASDDRTYNREDHPHLSGANVSITHPLTGQTLYSGVTGADGCFVVDSILEGYYNITVTADKHSAFNQSRCLINPGCDNEIEAMLWLNTVNYVVYPDPNDPDAPKGGGGEVDFDVDVDVDAAPALTVMLPKERPGMNMIVPVTVTNHGNVPVGKTEMTFIVPNGFEMEIIDKPWFNVIQANSTVTFSAVLRPTTDDADPSEGCFQMGATVHAQYVCGPHTRVIETTGRRAWGECSQDQLAEWLDPQPDPQEPGGTTPSPSLPTGQRFYIGDECNTVMFQLSRSVMMTGQNSEAWLTVTNNAGQKIENMRFLLELLDAQAQPVDADSLFDYRLASLGGALGGELAIGGTWTIGSRSKGVANIAITPMLAAAQKMPKQYYIGGVLCYTDPTTGEACSVKLIPVPLYVNPMPKLDLTYFIQRDIFGDDPFTSDVVEPSIPAEFSLLVVNAGNGAAPNVNIVTHKPIVMNNSTRKPIDFEFVGSQVNGSDFALCTYDDITTRFGTINSAETSYAQWWMTCNRLGYFDSYDNVNTNLVTSDADVSVIGDVSVHELIHSLNIDMSVAKPLKGFLVNDEADEADRPDRIYLTDGSVADVHDVAETKFTSTSAAVYTLRITPGQAGWNYGYVSDPTQGRQKLESVVRLSDGKDIDIHNFWQTDRTMPDGAPTPIYENLVHFADMFVSDAPQEYRLVYAYNPTVPLDVKMFEGVPESSTLLEEPLENLTVVFNKVVDANTFTVDDLSLTCQGNKVDLSDITIAAKSTSEYVLDLSKVTKDNGYYILTVNTKGIVDYEGFAGENLRFAEWMQLAGNVITLTAEASPAEGGKVLPESLTGKYGEKAMVKAEANEGYDFSHWTFGGKLLSQECEISVALLEDMALTANFIPRRYKVEILACADGGSVSGGGSGFYNYDEAVNLTAKANSGWIFDGWKVNGRIAGTSKTLSLNIVEDLTVEACFTNKKGDVSFSVPQGWSWVTFNMSDPYLQTPQDYLATVKDNVERLVDAVGHKELVQTPEIGLTGNLNSLVPSQSYQLKMENADLISLSGRIAMNNEVRLYLSQGWNWIGYVPTVTMDIADALGQLTPAENDVIKSLSGFATFADGKWTGTLTEMHPNEGYMYLSGGDNSFRYPANIFGKSEPSSEDADASPWAFDVHRYQQNLTVIAKLDTDSNVPVIESIKVGAFVGNECRGIGKWIDGRLFITIHGSEEDNDVTFRALYNGHEYCISDKLKFSADHVGTISEPFTLHLDVTTGIRSIDVVGDCNIYPNPVHNTLYLTGDVGNVSSVSIISMSGMTVMPCRPYNAYEGVDVSAIPSGNYIIAIVMPQGTVYKRFVKID